MKKVIVGNKISIKHLRGKCWVGRNSAYSRVQVIVHFAISQHEWHVVGVASPANKDHVAIPLAPLTLSQLC